MNHHIFIFSQGSLLVTTIFSLLMFVLSWVPLQIVKATVYVQTMAECTPNIIVCAVSFNLDSVQESGRYANSSPLAEGSYIIFKSNISKLMSENQNDAPDVLFVGRQNLPTLTFEREDYSNCSQSDMPCAISTSNITFEHENVPTDNAWVPIPIAGTVDGNPVQISVGFANFMSPPIQNLSVDLVNISTNEVIFTYFNTFQGNWIWIISFDWDSTGYAWNNDGTPRAPMQFAIILRDTTTGVEISRSEGQVKIIPKPVVLLHGLWANHKMWTDFKGYLTAAHPDWRGFAVGDRQVLNGTTLPGEMDTGSKPGNPLPILPITTNAGIARNYIEAVREGMNAWQIDVVGHSMGGLISRRYIQERMPDTPDGRPVVRNLIMLGTPNAGSACAWLYGTPSTRELRPEMMGRFNQTVTDRQGVNFFILAGDYLSTNPCNAFSDQEATDYLTLLGYSDAEATAIVAAMNGRNDGVVSVGSAFWGMNTSSRDILHGLHFSAPGIDWVYSQNAFNCFVRPRLALSPQGYPARIPSCESGSPAPDVPASTLVYDQSFNSTIEVASNATIDVPFVVGSATHLSLTLLAPPEIASAIIAPDGSTAAQTAANSGEASQGYRGYIIASPSSGTWIARLTNTSAEVSYGAVAAFEAGGTIDLDGTITLTGTNAVRITATLTNAGVPLPGASVTARMTDPDGMVGVPITLFDDGAHGDGGAGDGVYSMLTPALASGTHAAQIDAVGTGFTRASIVWVEIGASALDMTVTLQGLASANREIPVTVTPTIPGVLTFSGTVTLSESGTFTLTGLADGEYTVRVSDSHRLSVCQVVTLTGGQAVAQLTLRAGDANEDNVINISDFAILAASFGKGIGQAGFDARADFNEDGVITISDFSLLASNFGQAGCAA